MTGRERRQFTRVALDAYVRVIIPANRASIESRVRDLSENGVFLIARATRPIGTELQLHIDITPDLVIRAKGIVVHEVKADEGSSERPGGMGIMFLEIESDIEELRAFIASREPLS
jgi:hypothetical protein